MIPTSKDIIKFLETLGQSLTKRELYDAFKIEGSEKPQFKELLRDLEKKGVLICEGGKNYRIAEALPTITTVEIVEIDADGEVIATPLEYEGEGEPPKIIIIPEGSKKITLSVGDVALVKLRKFSDRLFEGIVIKKADKAKTHLVGVLRATRHGFRLDPISRREKNIYEVEETQLNGAEPNFIVKAEIIKSRARLQSKVRILETIGHETDSKAISLIAMLDAGMSLDFPQNVIDETSRMTVPNLKGREDLRDIPLITIDGADARDFDDAVFAEPDPDPNNKNGYHIIVAIADVAHYVRAHTALDKEAFKRGNSTYFPDRVVPMLPEKLSNDLCSLRPDGPRATLAVHLYINSAGDLLRYHFIRGLMQSHARLTYEEVQDAINGAPSEKTRLLVDPILKPLYEAWKILDKARIARGALDLDIPERKIVVNAQNEMTGVKIRERLNSHRVIEELMILANVAAAKALEAKKTPCIYRIHDRPTGDKLMSARAFLEAFGLSLPKGGITKPAELNGIITKAKAMESGFLINDVILRSQAQAVYSPENIGHFGLGLEKYAHFTSPIRRYADLLVHRALIKAYGLGDGGLDDESAFKLFEMAEHISATERTSAEAERSAVDRFTASYLKDKIGMSFEGRISGVTRFGLFVKLKDIGADGLIPIRSLPQDYYHHDERQHALVGRRTGRVFRLGAAVLIRVLEAEPLTGSMIFELQNGENGADIEGYHFSGGSSTGRFERRKHKEKRERIQKNNKKFKKKDKKKNSKTR